MKFFVFQVVIACLVMAVSHSWLHIVSRSELCGNEKNHPHPSNMREGEWVGVGWGGEREWLGSQWNGK